MNDLNELEELTARVCTAERELYNTYQQLSSFFENVPALCCVANVHGDFEQINAAFTDQLGWPSDELLNRKFYSFIHPEDVEKTLAEVGKLATNGHQTMDFYNRYLCSDGNYVKLHWTASHEDGKLYGVARIVK